MSQYQQIYTTVRKIPFGKVATYGQIADLAGLYGFTESFVRRRRNWI